VGIVPAPPYNLVAGREFFPLRSVDVSEPAGEPAFAIPFQMVPVLPGLVCYLIYRGIEDTAAVGAFVTTLSAILEREIRAARQRSQQRTARGASAMAYEIDWRIVLLAVATLLFLLLLWFAVAATITLLGITNPIQLLARLAAIAGMIVLGSLLADYRGVRSVDGDTILVYVEPLEPQDPPPERTMLRFPGMTIDGLPPDAAVALFDYTNEAYPIARDALAKRLRANLRV
jgi:hypothetical protein